MPDPRPRKCPRLLSTLLVCLLGTIMLGASPDDSAKRFGRVGHNMMCVCGCGQILLECNHVGCPDSDRMIGELRDQVASPNGAGADSLILNWFVSKYGATVLAAPIRGGFDTVAWIVPLATFAFGILGTAWLVKAWTARRRVTTLGAPGLDSETWVPTELDEATRARIRRETDTL